MLRICITTITGMTDAVRAFVLLGRANGARLVVVGDRKGPAACDLPETTFLSLQAQQEGPFTLARTLPVDHYARKNIAYMEAMRRGATCIYETDDDNAPLPSWVPRREMVNASQVVARPSIGASLGSRWVNVYRYFTPELIWPRGLPLDEIHTPVPELTTPKGVRGGVLRAPVQ